MTLKKVCLTSGFLYTMRNNIYSGLFLKASLLLFLILSLLLPQISAKSQPEIPKLYFQQFLDGLSQSNVRCIAEDHRGYLWIGTLGGLNRFDGTGFRQYEMDETNPNSIPDNRINDLFIDSRQNLWVATYFALALYVEKYEHFVIFNKEPEEGKENILDALTIFEDERQQIWVGTQHGVYKLDTSTRSMKRSDAVELSALDSLHVNSIDKIGANIWFATSEGLFIWDQKNHKLEEAVFRGNQKLTGEICDLLQDNYGRIWVSTEHHGLFRIDKDAGNRQKLISFLNKSLHPLKDQRIFHVFEDSQGRIWVGTEGLGLNLYLPDSDSFISYTKDPTDKMALKTNSIWKIFEDNSGRLFLGTNYHGMFMYDPYANNFNHKEELFGLRLKSNTVSSFLEVNGNIWIGTDGGGISVWDRENKNYTFLSHDPADKNSLGSDEVLCLFQDSKGIIWTGNWDGGLNRYDPGSGHFRRYRHNKSRQSPGSDNIFSIKEDRNGDLWMTSWGHGVSRYNRATDDFFHIGYVQYNSDHLAHNMTYDLEIDDLTGEIWVATVLGLDRITMLNDTEYKITHFKYDQDDSTTISAHNVHCILEDSEHQLWVGTSHGLNVFDRKTEKFQRFYEADGLPGNVIKDMIQDKNGNYWITTSKGMARMVKRNDGYEFEKFTKSDGLQSNEFFFNSSYETSSGEIFVGGINGFNHFDPDGMKANPSGPKMQFTGFKIFNKDVEIDLDGSVLSGHINTVDSITIKRKQSAFTIEFAGVNMSSPDKDRYAYKLAGFDQDWNEVGNQKVAIYTNLDAGEYDFLLKGANRDGVWSDEIRKIHICILPAWWQTFWARFLLISIPLILVIALVILRFSFIKAQKRQLAQQVDLQTTELREQKHEMEGQAEELRKLNQQKNKLFSIISHDLRSPVHSLQGITDMLDPDILTSKDLLMIRKDISHRVENIGKVMVNLLDWSKSQMEGENSKAEHFNIASISSEICNMYQTSADQKQIVLLNSIPDPTNVYADPNQIRIVIRNLIGNALKFTNADDIVSIGSESCTNGELVISISDTGIGMSEEKVQSLFQVESNKSTKGTSGETGVGLGLLMVKEFIEKNGGKIWVESAPGVGTTFRFTLHSLIPTGHRHTDGHNNSGLLPE